MLDLFKPAMAQEKVPENGPELESATLKRLIEEVRTASIEPAAYNRMHNRHNRT